MSAEEKKKAVIGVLMKINFGEMHLCDTGKRRFVEFVFVFVYVYLLILQPSS